MSRLVTCEDICEAFSQLAISREDHGLSPVRPCTGQSSDGTGGYCAHGALWHTLPTDNDLAMGGVPSGWDRNEVVEPGSFVAGKHHDAETSARLQREFENGAQAGAEAAVAMGLRYPGDGRPVRKRRR